MSSGVHDVDNDLAGANFPFLLTTGTALFTPSNLPRYLVACAIIGISDAAQLSAGAGGELVTLDNEGSSDVKVGFHRDFSGTGVIHDGAT